MKLKKYFILIFCFLFFSTSFSQNISYKNGVVSSAQELATQVGLDILKQGGNAIDAAVGVGFALAVVYPQAGNIGGGGFMVIHFKNGTNTSIDYREKAPSLAFRDMYLDSLGNVILNLSTLGHLAAGVPGSVAGMLYALDKYGTMDRKKILQYAIDLADTGFVVNSMFANNLNAYRKDFSNFPSTMEIFGKDFKEGDILVQKDLANTLREISEKGKDGFYKGKVADLIIEEMKRGNGIISHLDLENYEAKGRDVIKGTYNDYEIISMGPPSSGGICLIYLLNILENYDIKELGYGSEEYVQLMTEAMRRVYADRSEFMGDADFVDVPITTLISKEYAKDRMKDYNPDTASYSVNIKPGNARKESEQTTHYSIADKYGNLVSVTTTINDVFGNKLVVDGAGFFLNNEMDDFVSKPGVPNIYGLVGNEANAIEPNKRMLSSMTPTIVLKNGNPILVVGSPGGSRIITTVLQTILNVIEFNMNIDEAIDLPRFHHQWLPDEIQIEKGAISDERKLKLESQGYTLKEIKDFGRVDAIMFFNNGDMFGHSDRRGYGKALGY